jgi:hypothetical protein
MYGIIIKITSYIFHTLSSYRKINLIFIIVTLINILAIINWVFVRIAIRAIIAET